MAEQTVRMEKIVRTVPETAGKTASRAASITTMERAVSITGTIAMKDVRAAALAEIRSIQTTGENARTVRITTGTVLRDVLIMERTAPVPSEIIASRAVSEERMRAVEIPEESRVINLKVRIWNL